MSKLPIKEARDIAQRHGWDQVIVIARKVGDDGYEHVVTYGEGSAHCEAAARAGMAVKHHLMKWPSPLFDGDLRLVGTGIDAENPKAMSLSFTRAVSANDIRMVHEFLRPPTHSPRQVDEGA
ncbi:MAG: hypothetical protein ACPG61_15970 [Paracoccaceae bacterium]